jgi:uncharacterized protein
MSTAQALLVVLAFALGFCMARVSLCAVVTVRALVLQRKYAGITALAVAASSAGLVLLAVAWLWPGHASLPAGPPVSWSLAFGGVLLGIGALLNGGCYISSVTYVGTGNFHYLLTLVGFGLVARYATFSMAPQVVLATGADIPNHASAMFLSVAAGLIVFVAILALGAYIVRAGGHSLWLPLRSRWPWPLAAAACGLCAGLLNIDQPSWSYSKLIEALAVGGSAQLTWSLACAALAIFAGAITSALLSGQFHRANFSPLKAARCLLGGAVMGYGAAHVPGGNDSLLLWAIPGLALYGLVAYALMLGTIGVIFALQRVFSRA